ncbi:hypothetical protein M1N56_05400 [Dehalococcoidia bacterium]|nr:hypothetical protein [Dehalococcoidia bacterium]
MNKRRITSEATRNHVLELAFSGKSAAEIQRTIAAEAQTTGTGLKPAIPDVRTVQRIILPARLIKVSGEKWSLENNQEQLDSQLVLDTLGEIAVGTEGRVSSLTLNQAAWLLRIRQGTRGLSGWGAWILYKLCVEGNEYETSGLDIVLALRPWESAARTSSLQSLIDSGSIPEPACWSFIREKTELMKNGLLTKTRGEV